MSDFSPSRFASIPCDHEARHHATNLRLLDTNIRRQIHSKYPCRRSVGFAIGSSRRNQKRAISGITPTLCAIITTPNETWASSSAGRAPRSQRGGRGFESLLVHQIFNHFYCFSKLHEFPTAIRRDSLSPEWIDFPRPIFRFLSQRSPYQQFLARLRLGHLCAHLLMSTA